MRHSPLVAELQDAITPRAFLMMVGVFFVQLAFLLSYIGSFHHPEPHQVPLAVVAPQQVADKLDALSGDPVSTTRVKDKAAARKRIMDRDAQGAYVMDPRGDQDTLLIASGAGQSVTQALEKIGKQVAAGQKRKLRTDDIAPANAQDHGSLTAFYLVVGWLVGGYLAASMLGVTAGTRPATARRAVVRLGACAVYAALSGLGSSIVIGPVLGALPGHFAALWWLGALVVFGTCAVTIALQVLFGVVGIGLAIVIFVVLGNPSAGGAYQKHMIPPFWSALTDWLPAGAGTEGVRNIVYFAGNAMATPLVVLGAWALAGTVVTLIGAGRRRRDEGLTGLQI